MKFFFFLCFLKGNDSQGIQGAEEEEFLRTCAWQDSMAQKVPEIEFQMKSADLFRDIANAVKKDTVRMLFGVLNDEGGTITNMLLEHGMISEKSETADPSLP